MNRAVRRTSFVHLTLSLVVGAFLWPSQTAAFEILGQVTDDAGNPFPRARVELAETRRGYGQGLRWLEGKRLPEPVSTAVTDEHGAYRLQAPEPGLWRIIVSAPGHVPMEHGPEAIVDDVQLPPVALVADAGLSVTVATEGRDLLPGARVWYRAAKESRELWQVAHRHRWRPLHHPEVADDRGRVRLSRAEGETLEVRAWAPGHLETTVRSSQGRPVRFELVPGSPRAVEVRDPRGDPIEGVLLRVGDNGWTAALTDEDGRAEITIPEGEDVPVRLDAGDGRWTTVPVSPPAPKSGKQTAILVLPDARVVRGRVLDASTGEPVAGALVWKGNDSTRSNTRGSFELSFSGTTEVDVRASAAGYSMARMKRSLPDAGPVEVDLALEPAFQLRGHVVDAEGLPVAGAAVRWQVVRGVARPWANLRDQRRAVRTGFDGSFRIGPLEQRRTWKLRAELEGYAPAEARVTGADASDPVELVLEAGATLSGRVVGPDGQGMPGAEVRVFEDPRGLGLRSDSLRTREPERLETAKEAGHFEVLHVPVGVFALAVDAPGHALHVVQKVTVAEHTEIVDLGEIPLERAARIHGRVIDADGEPVTDAEVILGTEWVEGSQLLRSDATRPLDLQRAGSDGAFRFEELMPGTSYTVAARSPGRAPAFAEEIRASADAEGPPLELVLAPAARLFGEVVDRRDRPLPGTEVVLLRPVRDRGFKELSLHRRTTTDAQGRFAFEDLPAGRFLIQAPWRDFGGAQPDEILDLAAGEDRGPLRIVYAVAAEIHGRVLTPDGQPVATERVRVALHFDDAAADEILGVNRTRATDGAGRFRWDGLEPGEIRMTVVHPTLGRAERTVVLTEGIQEIDFRLEPTARIEGRVVHAVTDEPVPVASVFVLPAEDGERPFLDMADEHGHFAVPIESPGAYRLHVVAPGFQDANLRDVFQMEAQTVERVLVRLDPGATITGRITGLEPAELGRVDVWARSLAETDVMTRGSVSPEGRYRIPGVGSGAWIVQARLEDPVRETQARVILEEGQREAAVDLDFPLGYSLTGRVVAAGRPAAGARVIVERLDGARPPMDQQADSRGTFGFGDLGPGRYRVTAAQADDVAQTLEIDLVTDEDVEIHLTPTSREETPE